jgi:hypothetical protein
MFAFGGKMLLPLMTKLIGTLQLKLLKLLKDSCILLLSFGTVA